MVPRLRSSSRISRAPARRLASLGALTLAWCLAASAHAGPSAADKKAADALFEEGRAHVEAGEFLLGCPKLLASYKLDPTVGTLLNLADCHQRAGQTATAYEKFQAAAELAKKLGRADREKTARDRLDLLEPQLTKLALELKEPGDVTITLDGTPISRQDAQAPIRVDPGAHTLFVAAPDRKPFSVTLEAKEPGKTYPVVVPALTREGEEPPVVAPKPKVPPPEEPAPSNARRTTGFVVGGIGLVLAGVGGYFGLRTFSSWSDSQARCNDKGCDREGVDLATDAKTSGFLSTIGLAAGGVAFATGLVLVLTAPSAKTGANRIGKPNARLTPSVGPGAVGLSLGGTF
jgi:hypothetical protein